MFRYLSWQQHAVLSAIAFCTLSLEVYTWPEVICRRARGQHGPCYVVRLDAVGVIENGSIGLVALGMIFVSQSIRHLVGSGQLMPKACPPLECALARVFPRLSVGICRHMHRYIHRKLQYKVLSFS